MMKRSTFLRILIFLFAVFISSAICFFDVNNSQELKIAPEFNFYNKPNFETDYGFDEEDKTKFIFYWETKIWEYNVENFDLKSGNFEIDYELNKYKLNNNKNNKINTLKNLKKINIENKLIINYLFPNLIKKLNEIKKHIEKPCENASFYYSVKNNKINIIKEKIGIKINFELFYENILEEYYKNNIVKINIPIEKICPEICSAELEKSTNLRASYSTSFASSMPDRKHNIRQAVKKINGYILQPNETFSFNKIVGRRTAENGYRVAKIISQGEFVDGVGGGVCQVSTTLYNSVLLSGLKVESANRHSERVYYCKAGFDAMVNYGSSDLVFKNNTNNLIRIFANCDNERVYISIFGESLNGYSYKLKSEILDEVPAGVEEVIIDNEQKYLDKVEYLDEYFYLKQAKNGYVIKSYREVYSNGNLVRIEELRTDKYLPQNAVKVYGSKLRPMKFESENIELF